MNSTALEPGQSGQLHREILGFLDSNMLEYQPLVTHMLIKIKLLSSAPTVSALLQRSHCYHRAGRGLVPWQVRALRKSLTCGQAQSTAAQRRRGNRFG